MAVKVLIADFAKTSRQAEEAAVRITGRLESRPITVSRVDALIEGRKAGTVTGAFTPDETRAYKTLTDEILTGMKGADGKLPPTAMLDLHQAYTRMISREFGSGDAARTQKQLFKDFLKTNYDDRAASVTDKLDARAAARKSDGPVVEAGPARQVGGEVRNKTLPPRTGGPIVEKGPQPVEVVGEGTRRPFTGGRNSDIEDVEVVDRAPPRNDSSRNDPPRNFDPAGSGKVFDELSTLQPARHVVEALDTKYDVIRKLAREDGLIIDQVPQGYVSRNAKEVREALLDGQPVTGNEFNIMRSAGRQISIKEEYGDAVKKLKQLDNAGRRFDTEKLFGRMEALRHDDDFVQGNRASQAKTVNGINADLHAGKAVDGGQFEKIRAYYNKYYHQDGAGMAPGGGMPMMGGGTMGAQAISIAKQFVDKINDGKSVGTSISRSIYASTDVSIPRVRMMTGAAVLGGVGTIGALNADYIFNGPDKAGLSIAQIVPVGAIINTEAGLSEPAQLNFMAFQRNPHLYTESMLNNKPNPFYNYIEALKNQDTAKAQAQGLTKDQQDALGRIASAPKQGLGEVAEMAKAQAAGDTANREAQEASLALGAQQAIVNSGKNRYAPEEGVSTSEVARRLQVLANPALGIITPQQMDALATMMQTKAGGDAILTADEAKKLSEAVDADTELGLDTAGKQAAKQAILAPRP